MEIVERQITRRQLLAAAGGGATVLALGAAVSDSLGLLRGARSSTLADTLPSFRTRPDLRLPALTVTRHEAGASPGLIFIAPYNAPNNAQAGAVIADSDGRIVWEHPVAGMQVTNFQVQRFRGQPVLTWWQGNIVYGHGVGHYVIADTSYRVLAQVQAGRGHQGDLHEFQLTPQGTALLTAYDMTHADLSSVGGSTHGSIQDSILQEVDIATGRTLFEWHSLGNIALKESYPPVGADWDYFHINSIDVDSDNNLLVSSRSTQTIYKIDRRSGAIIWRLGGKLSDFAVEPGARFAWQHDARRQADGSITVFDNGAAPTVEKQSRGIVLDVDENAMTVGMRRQYTHPKALSAASQGNVQVLPNGNVFVGWGQEPYVSEFDPDGRLVFDARMPSVYQSYRAFRLPWTATPAAPPDVTASRFGPHVSVYASWNGQTTVDRWQVLAQQPPANAVPLGDRPATGFETEIPLLTDSRELLVRALDADGRTLAESRVLAV